MQKFIKNVIITDELDKELKHLTSNQIKLILITLSCKDIKPISTLYHRSNKRFLKSYQGILLNLNDHNQQIKSIQNTKIDKTNKKLYGEQLSKFKSTLKQNPYYKIPINTIEYLISGKHTKTELLFILKFYKVLNKTYHKSYTFKKMQFIIDTFGDISRKEMCIKQKILSHLICNIEVTISNI